MLDVKCFGEKLKNHRKNLGLTQENVAERIGVSAQAVSKWEAGDCLPDCLNLKAISELYGVSLDVLLETGNVDNIDVVSDRIEQMATEFVWSRADKSLGHADLGESLWKMWKSIYFAEVGDKKLQKQDKERGNLRVSSDYGLKIWDDDGIACVIKNQLKEKCSSVTEREINILKSLCDSSVLAIISALDTMTVLSKDELREKSGIDEDSLNALLLTLTENGIVAYENEPRLKNGYKLSAHCGICGYMILACAYILSKKKYTISEFLQICFK